MHLLLMQIDKTFHCAPSWSMQIFLHSLPLQRRTGRSGQRAGGTNVHSTVVALKTFIKMMKEKCLTYKRKIYIHFVNKVVINILTVLI